MKENFPKPISHTIENKNNDSGENTNQKSLFRKFAPLVGDAFLIGGMALYADGEFESYQNSRHKEEFDRTQKQKIELTQTETESIASNFLEKDLGVKNEKISRIQELIQVMTEQKENGEVDTEILLEIQTLAQEVVESHDGLLSQEGLESIKEMSEGIEKFFEAEAIKKMDSSISNIAHFLSEQDQFLETSTEYPKAIKKILETIDEYSNVFAEHFISPKVTEEQMKALDVWLGQEPGHDQNMKNKYLALLSMRNSGDLQDFFSGLGQKMNSSLIYSKYKEVSLKNYVEYMEKNMRGVFETKTTAEIAEMMQETMGTTDKEIAISISVVDGLARNVFMNIFTADNTEAKLEIVDYVEKSKASDENKKNIIYKIDNFSQKISTIVEQKNTAQKTISWEDALEQSK